MPSWRALLPVVVVAVVLGGGWLFANWPAGDEDPAAATATATSGTDGAEASAESYDLQADEERGGHTIERHVGRSEEQLRQRLEDEPDISAASSYPDLATAETIVAAALAANESEVADWESRTGDHENLALRYTHDEVAGIVLERGADEAVEVRSVVVVLAWDRVDWFVLTSYPDD